MSEMATPVDVKLEGLALLTDPLLNKGSAFTEEERTAFGLHGLLPPHISTLDEQITRRLQAVRRFETNLERYLFLRGLQDVNETLFYALLTRNLSELLPLVYTPTVGEGCQEYSHYHYYPRGLFLSWPHRDIIKQIIAHPRYDRVEVIVVGDGERILGLGDQGAGGMGIPVGKLALYTGCAGIDPATTLPVLLDVGTDNQERLKDPLYIGWRHERMRGQDYDDFVESFVAAVAARWPHVLLQWEDFGRANAGRLLAGYRDRLLTFNDDIQGTAAVAAGTLLAAVNVIGVPITEQRIAIVGAGSAGCGIAALLLQVMIDAGLSEREAPPLCHRPRRPAGRGHEAYPRFPGAVRAEDRSCGRMVARAPEQDRPPRCCAQRQAHGVDRSVGSRRYVQRDGDPRHGRWGRAPHRVSPLQPHLLRRGRAAGRDESDGRAVIGTGSPFPPVIFAGRTCAIAQTNNAYVFPGMGLGVLAAKARRVSDGMFAAAAKALAEVSPALKDPAASLLPSVSELRSVAVTIAGAVAKQARADGLCAPFDDAALPAMISAKMREPVYRTYRRKQ
jgi:malate dehydrogenase (oxaloacetate-decarboxylating)